MSCRARTWLKLTNSKSWLEFWLTHNEQLKQRLLSILSRGKKKYDASKHFTCGGEREGDGCLADWVGWMQKLSGVIHHLISGIAGYSSELSALAWEVTYQISDWLFALVILHLLLTCIALHCIISCKDIYYRCQDFPRTFGSFPRCLVEVGVTAKMRHLWYCSGLARPARRQIIFNISFANLFLWPGGHGSNKALGRVLLEQNINKQSCLRTALNSMFEVQHPHSE